MLVLESLYYLGPCCWYLGPCWYYLGPPLNLFSAWAAAGSVSSLTAVTNAFLFNFAAARRAVVAQSSLRCIRLMPLTRLQSSLHDNIREREKLLRCACNCVMFFGGGEIQTFNFSPTIQLNCPIWVFGGS